MDSEHLTTRLKNFQMVVDHIGKNKQLVIEDDTCLGRILAGFRTLLINENLGSSLHNEFIQSLLTSCSEILSSEDSDIFQSHLQFIISLIGILCSKNLRSSNIINTTTLKRFIELGKSENFSKNSVLDSWLLALYEVLSSPSSVETIYKLGFDVSLLCTTSQSTSIFVSKNSIKCISQLLLVLFENEKIGDFKVKLINCVETIRRELSIETILQIFTHGIKKDVKMFDLLIVEQFSENNLKFFEIEEVKRCLLEAARCGNSILSDFVFCYFSHNQSQSNLLSEQLLKQIISGFLTNNPLKEVGYRMISSAFGSLQEDWFTSFYSIVFDVYLKRSSQHFELSEWKETVQTSSTTRSNVTKIASCSIESLMNFWRKLSLNKQQSFYSLFVLLLENCYEMFNENPIGCLPELCRNEKVSTILLKSITKIEEMKSLKICCFCVNDGKSNQVIQKITKSKIYSCQVIKYSFSILMLQLKSVQSCPEHQHQSHQIINTLFDLYFESVESYLEWELRDEGFECLSRLLEFFSDEEQIIYEMLANQSNKLLNSVKSGIEDTVNYVRSSALRFSSSWITFLSDHLINHFISKKLTAFSLYSLMTDGDEIVRRAAVSSLQSAIDNCSDCDFNYISSYLIYMLDVDSSNTKNVRIFGDDFNRLTLVELKDVVDDKVAVDEDQNSKIWRLIIHQILYITLYDLDIEVRCDCLDVFKTLCDRMKKVNPENNDLMKDLIFRFCLDDNKTVSEHASSVASSLSLNPHFKVRSNLDADMDDLDSLLEDVTFRIKSSYTSLCSHHGNQLDCY